MEQKETWGSKLGFIMAAAGSAVGLGNIWKFPYTAGNNGGGAFVIIYLIFVALIGFSVMLTEFAVGRRKNLAAVGAYKAESRSWTFAGVIGVLAGLIIMGFYPVVGGWALAYVFKVFTGLMTSPDMGAAFGGFITATWEPLIWMVIYLALNIIIVSKGVAGGIEKAGKVLMPLLFFILIFITIYGFTLPNAMEGVKFLFKPDFSKVTGSTVLAALGQAFFSLSLGMGCMITYGSYLDKKENIVSNAAYVTIMDTAVALLAGLAMFPAIFSFGMEVAAGPGLVFGVIPTIFSKLGTFGMILSGLFFIALTVAALTSSVSLLEVVVAYFIEERNMGRKKAVAISSTMMVIMCVLSSISLQGGLTIFGQTIFDVFDLLSADVFMSIGGILIAVFAGWKIKKEDLKNEVTSGGEVKFGLFSFWYAIVKYVIPVVIAIVAVSGIMARFETGKGPIMIIGLAIMAILAIFSRKL